MQTLQVVRDLLYKAKERQLELEKKEATLVKERTQVCWYAQIRAWHKMTNTAYMTSGSARINFCHLQNQAKLTALEDRNSKLEYQILHLKRAVKAGDSAQQAAHPQH